MNKKFCEQYNQEQQLESGLASHWGYILANKSIDSKEKKHIQTTQPVVANITLRKFSKEIQKTDKIKQVQDEIRGIQNERMLRELKQSKYKEPTIDQKSEVICLMQNMIEDYNNIIQHKHITNNKTSKYQQNYKLHQIRKKENEKLLELIENKKKQLLKADLKQQIRINKEIAQLYRQQNDMEYNLSTVQLKNNRSIPPEVPFTYKTMKKHQSETFDKLQQLATIQNLNKFLSLKMSNSQENLKQMVNIFRKQSDISGSYDDQMIKKKMKQLQFQKFHTRNRKASISYQNTNTNNINSSLNKNKNSNKKSLQQQFKEPFLDKKQVEEYRQMQKKIRSNSEALDLWKSKINDASRNSRLKRQAERAKQINKRKQQVQMQNRQEQIENILENSIQIMSIDPTNANNVFTKELRENQRNQQIQKQKIFAEILRKKHNKFNKLWGTRILIKYDSQKQAKSMLKGVDEKRPNRKVKSLMSHRRNLSFTSHLCQKDANKLNKTQQINIQSARSMRNHLKQTQESWLAEQKDQQHYWRMCKNEKINLLLKRR